MKKKLEISSRIVDICTLGHKLTFREDRCQEGINAYDEVIKLNPDYAIPYLYKSIIYINRVGDYKKALDNAGKAEKLGCMGGTFIKIAALYRLGKKVEAEALYNQVESYYFDDFDSYVAKAFMHSHLGEYELNIESFERALLCNSEWKAIAYNNMATTYLILGQYERAIEIYNQALENDPKYIHAYKNIASCYNKLGKQQEALDVYNKIINDYPEVYILTTAAYAEAAKILKSLGHNKEAMKYFNQSKEAAKNVQELDFTYEKRMIESLQNDFDLIEKELISISSYLQENANSDQELKKIQNATKVLKESLIVNKVKQIINVTNSKKDQKASILSQEDIIKKLVADNQDLKAKNEFFMEMITQLSSRLEALESTELKVALVSDIVYDNELLNHFEILEPAIKAFGISQVLDMSRNLSPALISEAVEQNNGELLLAGCISLNHVDLV